MFITVIVLYFKSDLKEFRLFALVRLSFIKMLFSSEKPRSSVVKPLSSFRPRQNISFVSHRANFTIIVGKIAFPDISGLLEYDRL